MERRIIVLIPIILLLLGGKFSLSYAQKKDLNLTRSHEDDMNICMRNKDYPCVIEHLNSILKDNPGCLECYNGLGIMNYYLGNYEEAILFLNRTIEQFNVVADGDPRDLVTTFTALGIVYSQINQYEKAEENLVRAIKHFQRLGEWREAFFVEAILSMVKHNNGKTE